MCSNNGKVTFFGNWMNKITLVQKKPRRRIKELKKKAGILYCLFPPTIPYEVTIHVMLNPPAETYYNYKNSILLGPVEDSSTYEFNGIEFEGINADELFFVPHLMSQTMSGLNNERIVSIGGFWKHLKNSPWGVLMKTELVCSSIIKDDIKDFGHATKCNILENDKCMLKCFRFSYLCAKFVKKFISILDCEFGNRMPHLSLVLHGPRCTPVLKYLEPVNILHRMKKTFVINSTVLGSYHPQHLDDVKDKVGELGVHVEYTFERFGATLCDQIVNATEVSTEIIKAQFGCFRVLEKAHNS